MRKPTKQKRQRSTGARAMSEALVPCHLRAIARQAPCASHFLLLFSRNRKHKLARRSSSGLPAARPRFPVSICSLLTSQLLELKTTKTSSPKPAPPSGGGVEVGGRRPKPKAGAAPNRPRTQNTNTTQTHTPHSPRTGMQYAINSNPGPQEMPVSHPSWGGACGRPVVCGLLALYPVATAATV
jgi:hypothetical protein